MKKFIILIIFILLFTSCSKKDLAPSQEQEAASIEKYELTFYDTFDTVISAVIYSDDEKKANEDLNYLAKRFRELNALFDRYKSYDGVINVKTINDNAGKKPVKVDDTLFKLIKTSKEDYIKISSKNNIAMGPIIDVWKAYSDKYIEGKTKEEVKKLMGNYLPDQKYLETLRKYTDINKIILDENNNTVYLEDPHMSLDLGSVAKGYATEIVGEELRTRGVKSALISAGGNVKLIGKPLDGRDKFSIGIQNPDLNDENQVFAVLEATDISIVTSGDYQRFFDLDGKRYPHIIDPVTLRPSDNLKSTTVILKDSGLCDFISTAAFLSDEKDISKLAEKTDSKIIWIDNQMNIKYTPGAEKYIVKGD